MSQAKVPPDLPIQILRLAKPPGPGETARRRAAHDAALSLARDGGYEAVTMERVAERSGVSRATLYKYFISRDHLLYEAWQNEVARQHAERDLRWDEGTVSERLRAIADEWIEGVLGDSEPRLKAAIWAAARRLGPEKIDCPNLWPFDAFTIAFGETVDSAQLGRGLQILGYAATGIATLYYEGRISAEKSRADLLAAIDACLPRQRPTRIKA